jgi:uncharacterized protein
MTSHHSARDVESGMIVGRLLPGTDLLGGLEIVCTDYGVRFAAITFAYGSLDRSAFKTLQPVEGQDRPVLMPIEVDERVEFLGGQGLVCETEEGGRDIHLHGCIADASGRVRGGHFIKGKNVVFNNVDFALMELPSLELIRSFDEQTSTFEMTVRSLHG